jgi:hypothetical protein
MTRHGYASIFRNSAFATFFQCRARHLVDKPDLARRLEIGETVAAGGHDAVVQILRQRFDARLRDDEHDGHLGSVLPSYWALRKSQGRC